MRIYDLKVEHKTEPLGIDGNDPLFSFLCDDIFRKNVKR